MTKHADAFGQSLWDARRSGSAWHVIEREDGLVDPCDAADYLRPPTRWGKHERQATAYIDYLMVSPDEMHKMVAGTGWHVSRVLPSPGSTYIAILQKDGSKAKAAPSNACSDSSRSDGLPTIGRRRRA